MLKILNYKPDVFDIFVLTRGYFSYIRQANLENFYPKRIVKIKL